MFTNLAAIRDCFTDSFNLTMEKDDSKAIDELVDLLGKTIADDLAPIEMVVIYRLMGVRFMMRVMGCCNTHNARAKVAEINIAMEQYERDHDEEKLDVEVVWQLSGVDLNS